jgi:nucleoside-diphosphate-sugar epimerase
MANPLANDLDHILSRTRDLWEEFRGKRIFITGGTGFFGTWILETLAWANSKLDLDIESVVLTRNISSFGKRSPHIANNKSFSFLEGDVKTFGFPTRKVHYIIHAATDSTMKYTSMNSLSAFDDITEGTRHVLDFAVKCRASNILYVSSGAVYGKQPGSLARLDERYLGGPSSADSSSVYAEGKRTAEMLCVLYSNRYNLAIKITRCFAFVGPWLPLDKHFAIGNFILDAVENKPIIVKGDGTPVRSYLYASDLTIWLLTILIRGKNCYPYNVGSERGITIEELATLVSKTAEKPVGIQIRAKKSERGEIDRFVPSTQRAQKELKLKQTINLKSAIHNTIRFAELSRNEK